MKENDTKWKFEEIEIIPSENDEIDDNKEESIEE